LPNILWIKKWKYQPSAESLIIEQALIVKKRLRFMYSYKRIVFRGLLLGFAAGLVVTFFDSFYILVPKWYVPPSYPVLIAVFNTILWTGVGGLSGVALWLYMLRKKEINIFLSNENYYWSIFFLVPFAVIYGMLGRLYIPVFPWFITEAVPAYDRSLSILFVAGVLIFLIFYLMKKTQWKNYPGCLFVFELATFAMLYNFCANIAVIQPLQNFCNYMKTVLNIQLELAHMQIIIYIAGLLFIAGFFAAGFYARDSLLKASPVNKIQVKIIVLLFVAVSSLTGFFTLKTRIYFEKAIPDGNTGSPFFTGTLPRVILIVLDTVRADSISLFDDSGATKNLRMLANDSLVFDNCIATSPSTIPSHATIFTGLYSSEHGTHGILGTKEISRFRRGLVLPPLSEIFVTLAEVFKGNGYKTAAVVSNFCINEKQGFTQGFQIVNSTGSIGFLYNIYPFRPAFHIFCYITNLYPKYTLYYLTAEDINRVSIRVLKSISSKPFFLFINYLDAHAPYRPPRPFLGAFVSKTFPQLYSLEQHIRRLIIKRSNWKKWLSLQRELYKGEIAYLDQQLGKLFYYLKETGLYDSSLIVVTSDHGELFGEHGSYGHRKTLYEDEIRVPLIIKLPYSKQVGRQSKMLDLCDIYPTILSLCGMPVPSDISGKPFGDNSSLALSEFYNFDIGRGRAIYFDRYKYILYEHQREPELYNLDKDPEESNNLAKTESDTEVMLREKLSTLEEKHVPRSKLSGWESKEYVEELQKKLKALGYIQ